MQGFGGVWKETQRRGTARWPRAWAITNCKSSFKSPATLFSASPQTCGPCSFWFDFCLGSLLLSSLRVLLRDSWLFVSFPFVVTAQTQCKVPMLLRLVAFQSGVVAWRLSHWHRECLPSALFLALALSAHMPYLFWWIEDPLDTLKHPLQTLQGSVVYSLLLTALFRKKPNSFGLSKNLKCSLNMPEHVLGRVIW